MTVSYPSEATTGEAMLKIDGGKLRALREGAGLSREGLARAVGMHWTHLLKLEQGLEDGRPRSTSEENAGKLAAELGVQPEEFTVPSGAENDEGLSPLEVWARAHGVTVKHAATLARAGRIEGARKKMLPGRGSGYGRPVWVIPKGPEASRLPPTEAEREKWREYWQLYERAEAQRQRRRRQQSEEESDG